MEIKTLLEEEEKEIRAKALETKARLDYYFHTTDWECRTFYNMGWHYRVTLGSISVIPSGDKFYALINNEKNKPGGGLAAWTLNDKLYNTPQDAVMMAMNAAIGYMNKIKDAIETNLLLLRLTEFNYVSLDGKKCARCGGKLMPSVFRWAILIHCETCGQEHNPDGSLTGEGE